MGDAVPVSSPDEGVDTEPDPGPTPDPEADAGAEPDAATTSEPQPEPGPAEPEPEPDPGPTPDPEADAGAEPDAATTSEPEPGLVPEPEPEPEAGGDEGRPGADDDDRPDDDAVADAARSAVAKARAAASDAAVPVAEPALEGGRHLKPERGGPLRTDEGHRRLLVVALVVLALATAGLVPLGINEVWTGTAGHYVGSGMEPDDPNYVALVTPTPTLLVASVHTDPATGEPDLTGVALLALHPHDEGGAVLVLPGATVAVSPDTSADEVQDAPTLAEAYDSGGVEAVRDGVEDALVVEVADQVEVNADGWASLAAPSGAVEVITVDSVGDRWPAGRVQLEPAEIGEFLWTATPDESELVRLGRHERFWEGWLAALSEQGPAALPGEADAGLGLFVGGLTSGSRSVLEVPMVSADTADESSTADGVTGAERLVVDPEAVGGIVAAEVPFPQEPAPGARTRISLLNGTPDEQLGQQAVRPLVEEGAEIAITGNAASFSEPETLLIYTDPEARAEAHALRNALGVGSVEERVPSGGDGDLDPVTDDGERIDVTVILGADAPGAIRRLETTG